MHKKSLYPALFLLLFMALVFSCSKSANDSNEPEILAEKLTYIFISNGAGNYPDTIQFAKGIGEKLLFLSKSGSGNLKLAFHGKNNSDIVDSPKVLYTTAKRWHLKDGDTIRVFENNRLKHLFITSGEDSTAFGGLLSECPPRELLSESELRINNYFRTAVSNEKFASY